MSRAFTPCMTHRQFSPLAASVSRLQVNRSQSTIARAIAQAIFVSNPHQTERQTGTQIIFEAQK